MAVLSFPVTAFALDGDELDTAVFEQIADTQLDNLVLDLQPFYDLRPRTATYALCAASYAAFCMLPTLIAEQASACVRAASERIETLLDGRIGWTVQVSLPYDWMMWACLYKQFRNKLGQTLAAHITVRAVENETLDIILSLPDADTVFADRGESGVFQSWMDYSNLRTLYDAQANSVAYRMPDLTPEYCASLVFPLDDAYIGRLKDTWYQSRSGGRRKHMGTDIKANRKAVIYSSSDGDVVSVGSNAVGGYYVAVRDDFGYLYLYFHMFKNSQKVSAGDRVTAGQPIGLVGNTGNSEANHLHFGIISPDWTYVNSYTVLSAVVKIKAKAPVADPLSGSVIG